MIGCWGNVARIRRQAQDAGVEGYRPAILRREPGLERGHRGTYNTDADPAEVIEWRLIPECSGIGEIGRLRRHPCGQRAISPTDLAMAGRAVGSEDFGTSREGRCLRGKLVQRDSELGGQGTGKTLHPSI